MSDKRHRVPGERPDRVRGAAVRAEGMARRLLRRTRSLAEQASQHLPRGATTTTPDVGDGRVTTALPPVAAPARASVAAPDDTALLRARLERAEHAAAWLRARLRSERRRGAATPRVDAAALAADLTHDLSRLRAYDTASVGQVVRRVLSTHGLPVHDRPASPKHGATSATVPGWTRAQQDAVAARVIARAPEVSSPLYAHQALILAAGQGGTLARLTRASGLDSAMSKRRLRLALDALVTLGALTLRDEVYALTPDYKAVAPSPRPSPHRDSRNRR